MDSEQNEELDERIAVVCPPTAWSRDHVNLMPGVTTIVCVHCGTDVWLSPNGQVVLATRENAEPCCVPCSMIIMLTQVVSRVEPMPASGITSEEEDLKRRLL
jgi:hypothetical protein